MEAKRALTTRLLWRVYSYGILMLALAGGASFVVGTYVITPAVEGPARPSTAWIAWHLMEQLGRAEDVTQELVDLREESRMEMSFYAPDGVLLASNATPPPPPLPESELRRLSPEVTKFGGGDGFVASLDSAGKLQRYAQIRYPLPELPLGTALAQLAAALGVLGLLSIPLARSVTARVEKLTQATKAFGAGDLSVRVRSRQADEIGDLTRAFDEMADRIVQLRRSEKELLANVSHEVRTPLARIRMALDLVRDGDRTRAARYLEDIEDDLQELEELLNDVMSTARLDLARGETGDSQAPLRREKLEAGHLLEAAVTRFERRYPERRLGLHFTEDLPLIHADPTLLRRALDNLLDNAAKFSNADQDVDLRASRAASGHLVIEVRDRGIGIAAEDLERVFEPFFRSDRSRARETGGVGLGLALVKRIVEAHEGRVEIQSDKTDGTRFVLTLPTL